MTNCLKEKVVIITGGSRGIGRACCLAFAKSGANIVFTYNKNKTEANTLIKELKRLKINCLSIQLDIRDYKQCQQLVDKTLKDLQRIDVLVNNVGIIKDKALVMMSPDDWEEVIETNLGGVFNMTRAVITTFMKQRNGYILNMSSVSGITGTPRQTNYSASKAGIIGFSKSLAKEVMCYNIRVNVICPGYINTDMVSSLKEDMKKKIIETIPAKRLGRPEEIADYCVFLASRRDSYMTGEVIKIDGGLAI